MLSVILRKQLFAAGLVLVLTPALLTAAPAAPAKGKTATPAEKLRGDLDQNCSVEINEQPLDLALKQLHELTKINFVLDWWTLQQMGMQPAQMPVNVKLKDVKVKSALRSVLTPFQLSYAIIGDTVLVSTDEMVMYKQMRQRVSLDFEKEDLATALKKLARETATNLLVDSRAAKEAKMEVSLQMEDVPLETAVRLMAEMAGLKPVRVGNVLFVTTKTNAAEMRADPDLTQPNGPRSPQEMQLMIQQGLIAPGGGVVVPPPAPAVAPPGIGTVPVNPPPPAEEKKTEEKKTEPAEKPDKNEEKKNEEKPAAPRPSPAQSPSP